MTHLQVLDLITPAKSLLSCKSNMGKGRGMRTWTSWWWGGTVLPIQCMLIFPGKTSKAFIKISYVTHDPQKRFRTTLLTFSYLCVCLFLMSLTEPTSDTNFAPSVLFHCILPPTCHDPPHPYVRVHGSTVSYNRDLRFGILQVYLEWYIWLKECF